MIKLLNQNQGFSLIELAVVMIILGLLLSGILSILPTTIEYRQIQSTQSTLKEINNALHGFAVIFNRLPCPDTNLDGIENCPAKIGTIPWADLGVGRYDAWGRAFNYEVDSRLVDTIQVISLNQFEIELMKDHNDDTSSLPIEQRLFVPAVIWSRGRITQTRSDDERFNGSGTYIFNVGHTPNKYDDIVKPLSWYILAQRLVLSGQWPLD